MKFLLLTFAFAAAAVVLTLQAQSSDLHMQLQGHESFSRKKISYECDGNAAALGLPTKTFQVEYIHGAGNSLAILPIAGRSLIFAGILSGSGARYAADRFIWSDGGSRGAFLSSDLLNNQEQSLCHAIS